MKYKITLEAEDEWERDRFKEWYPNGFKRSGLRMPKVVSIELILPIEKRGRKPRKLKEESKTTR